MKTKINMRPTGRFGLLLALLVMSPLVLSAADEVPKRHALVYMSDGTEYEGILQLTPGIDMKMTKLPGGDEKTGTVDLEDIRAKSRVFTFNFDVVKEMTFSPLNEEYLKKFKILNISNKGAEVKKVRVGLPYPVLKPKCKVLFNSGETTTGVLGTRTVYLKIIDPDTGFALETKKFVRDEGITVGCLCTSASPVAGLCTAWRHVCSRIDSFGAEFLCGCGCTCGHGRGCGCVHSCVCVCVCLVAMQACVCLLQVCWHLLKFKA